MPDGDVPTLAPRGDGKRARGLGVWASLVVIASALSGGISPASPQMAPPRQWPVPGVRTSFVPLGNGVPGMLYEPATPGPKARIALFVMHASGDYLTFSACGELSRRGYRVLCANNSASKSGTFDDGIFDRVLGEARLGVAYLRSLPDVDKIVLFGHSGGATIMTAYQAIAENGVAFCQNADKIHRCPNDLAGLPKADGIVLADANWGQAEMTLLSIDPAVTDETSGARLDPALDMFNPANGYDPSGSHYSSAFVRKFLAAVARRNGKLLAAAQNRLAAIEAGRGDYVDDEPFIVPGSSFIGNRLFTEDVRLLAHSQNKWPLLHGDGTVTTEIVQSLRKATGRQNPTPSMARGALKTTVRNYLGSYAIRVTPEFGYDESSVHGVDWTSTYASPPGNVESVEVPLLAMGMTGNWEGLAAETIYEHARASDKSIAFVEGADHMYNPCKRCETRPGQFGDTVKTTYDYIDRWLSKPGRFL